MPGELERLIQALVAPKNTAPVQASTKLLTDYETLVSLTDTAAITYPVPAARWHPDPASAYVATVLNDVPLAYWRLGEASGLSAGDVRGLASGTISGGVTLGQAGALTGDSNAAMQFDGSTGKIDCGSPSALDTLSALTVEAWVKVSAGNLGGARDAARRNQVFAFGGGWTARRGRLWVYNGGWVAGPDTTTNLDDGLWHYLAGVYNGTDIRIYVDGASEGSPVAASGALGTGTGALTLGTAGVVEFWQGLIDDVAIYDTALSSARILAHHQAGRATGGDGLTTRWGECAWAA